MSEKQRTGSDQWLIEASVAEMQRAMEAGETTSEQLTRMYLARIEKYDRQGVALKTVIEMNPDAVYDAMRLDEERVRGGSRGPLHGIPVLLKDNIDTNDRMHTSAGSLAMKDNYAKQDSFIAAKLRAAGAVFLGKANMTEWANFMTDGMPSGYSSRGGQTLNPYGPGKYEVGGSSSGSASAVAANLTAIAVGTETSGSIINPASHNGIVGIKPTVGLISRAGVIPIAHSQDTTGPMARTVQDAAILLSAMAGSDPQDSATSETDQHLPSQSYESYLDDTALKGARIGIPRSLFMNRFSRAGEQSVALFEQAIRDLRECGATIVDNIEMPSALREFGAEVLRYEFKVDLNAYFSRLPSDSPVPIRTLQQLIEFNEAKKESMLKYGQTVLQWAEDTSGTLAETEYVEARKRDLLYTRDRGIDHALQTHELGALLLPGSWNADLAARAGYPSITIPAGYTSKGPLGITFVASAYSEPKLIALAYAYEQATNHRIPPSLD